MRLLFAILYVYAQRDTPATKWLPITIDGAPAAELRRGACFAIQLPPGAHTLSTPSGVPLSLDLQNDQPAFVRLDWNQQLNRPPVPVLSRVPQTRAEKEMMFLSYVPANKIHSTAVPKIDPRQPAQPEFKARPPQ